MFLAAGLPALSGLPSQGQAAAATSAPSFAPAKAPYVATMTFDVASVRQNKVDLTSGYTMGGGFVPHTATVRLMNWGIENLIGYAFGVNGNLISGTPRWPYPSVFVIEAKGDTEANAKLAALPDEQQWAEQQHMLQALLEERFHLKTHWETRPSDVYNLVVVKGGPKLGAGGSIPPSAEQSKAFGDGPVPSLSQKNDGQGYDFTAHNCSIDDLVEMLAEQFGRPVFDRTRLPGTYDFVLKYKGRWDRDRDADDLDPLPPMDRALQEELGLKVEAARGPVKLLVIDHIEKPSEN